MPSGPAPCSLPLPALARSTLATGLFCLLLGGCGGGGPGEGGHDPTPRASAAPAGHQLEPADPEPPPARCSRGAANCASASGRIIYIEAVDADGDGDAHFVLASAESVTAPGISVIDVERELRPHPLPPLGARVSAAGPVYRGSYGQRQIEATVLRFEATPESGTMGNRG